MEHDTNFRTAMTAQSKDIMARYSFPLDLGFDYTHEPSLKSAWVNDVVMKHPELSIKADLTFRQAINENVVVPIMGARPINPQRYFIKKADAICNIAQFVERMNYASYRNAFKRYGKRLRIVSAIEGGIITKTRKSSNGHVVEYEYDTGKKIHAHLILSRPKHIPYDDFEKLIMDNWLATKWGLWINRIEMIGSLKGAAKYQVKTSLDALDLQNTNLL